MAQIIAGRGSTPRRRGEGESLLFPLFIPGALKNSGESGRRETDRHVRTTVDRDGKGEGDHGWQFSSSQGKGREYSALSLGITLRNTKKCKESFSHELGQRGGEGDSFLPLLFFSLRKFPRAQTKVVPCFSLFLSTTISTAAPAAQPASRRSYYLLPPPQKKLAAKSFGK